MVRLNDCLATEYFRRAPSIDRAPSNICSGLEVSRVAIVKARCIAFWSESALFLKYDSSP